MINYTDKRTKLIRKITFIVAELFIDNSDKFYEKLVMSYNIMELKFIYKKLKLLKIKSLQKKYLLAKKNNFFI